MLRTIPFYSQHWNLDEWKGLRFESRADALYWQNSSCGILCLKMAAEGMLDKNIGATADIIREGQSLGAYVRGIGWAHSGLAQLAQKLGIRAFARERITIADLKEYVDAKGLSIVSIKSAFKSARDSLKERILFWKKFGGHLALVIGYNEQGFQVHHTSIHEEYNWENATIPFAKFEKAFTGRGVILTAPNPSSVIL